MLILAAPVDKSMMSTVMSYHGGVDLAIAHALALEASQNRRNPYQQTTGQLLSSGCEAPQCVYIVCVVHFNTTKCIAFNHFIFTLIYLNVCGLNSSLK